MTNRIQSKSEETPRFMEYLSDNHFYSLRQGGQISESLALSSLCCYDARDD